MYGNPVAMVDQLKSITTNDIPVYLVEISPSYVSVGLSIKIMKECNPEIDIEDECFISFYKRRYHEFYRQKLGAKIFVPPNEKISQQRSCKQKQGIFHAIPVYLEATIQTR